MSKNEDPTENLGAHTLRWNCELLKGISIIFSFDRRRGVLGATCVNHDF